MSINIIGTENIMNPIITERACLIFPTTEIVRGENSLLEAREKKFNKNAQPELTPREKIIEAEMHPLKNWINETSSPETQAILIVWRRQRGAIFQHKSIGCISNEPDRSTLVKIPLKEQIKTLDKVTTSPT